MLVWRTWPRNSTACSPGPGTRCRHLPTRGRSNRIAEGTWRTLASGVYIPCGSPVGIVPDSQPEGRPRHTGRGCVPPDRRQTSRPPLRAAGSTVSRSAGAPTIATHSRVHQTLYLPERVITEVDGIPPPRACRLFSTFPPSSRWDAPRGSRTTSCPVDVEAGGALPGVLSVCPEGPPRRGPDASPPRGKRVPASSPPTPSSRGERCHSSGAITSSAGRGRHGCLGANLEGRRDFVYQRQRVILELDGRRWHSRDQDFETDRERDNAAVLAGYRPLRFTWRQVTRERSTSSVCSARRSQLDPSAICPREAGWMPKGRWGQGSQGPFSGWW